MPGKWKVDLSGMTSKNVFTGMEVRFERNHKGFYWKISYMPMDLLAKYANMPNGKKAIKCSVMDAYEAFLKVYNKGNTKKAA